MSGSDDTQGLQLGQITMAEYEEQTKIRTELGERVDEVSRLGSLIGSCSEQSLSHLSLHHNYRDDKVLDLSREALAAGLEAIRAHVAKEREEAIARVREVMPDWDPDTWRNCASK